MENNGEKRPDWDEYFLRMVEVVSVRATCDRGKSGCVIVKDNHILTTGYVGSPSGLPHCVDAGHMMRDVIDESGSTSKHCIRAIHAEQNAICQAARLGIALYGSTIYCTMEPCFTCAKMIVNSGIIRVVAKKKYHSADETRGLFKKANIRLDVITSETEQY